MRVLVMLTINKHVRYIIIIIIVFVMVVVYSLLSLLPLLLFLSLLIIDTANSRGESDTTPFTRKHPEDRERSNLYNYTCI